MHERNIIGGFTAAVLAPFVEGWQQMLWFLILAVILILGYLRFGIAAEDVVTKTQYEEAVASLQQQIDELKNQ